MKDSRRLRPVARIAHQQERNAARQLGDCLRQVEQQQKKLDDLLEYREQYIAGFQAAGKQGVSVVQLRDYQLFLRRLDTAVTQQRQLLRTSRQHCEQSQSEWHNRHGHSMMIDKVVENRQQVENRKRDEREQREQDDRPKDSGNGVLSDT
ncbi:MAG: flagellar export protein FliJ [Gammaproteobacteria bacterium]|jgi:flagellar FliJ protein